MKIQDGWYKQNINTKVDASFLQTWWKRLCFKYAAKHFNGLFEPLPQIHKYILRSHVLCINLRNESIGEEPCFAWW